ncbi:MAG: hypothetical protein RBT36_08175 [Desulfobulbus sp.]|jgi:hypothetical protein|nr:hypothetical protein [Desulfobulbus sp.]
MSGINDIRPSLKNDGSRDSDKIRRDIVQAEQQISQTVEQIGERIKETMDWKLYVKDAPYLALGIAVGLGYLASGILATRKTSADRLLDTLTDEVRATVGGITDRAAGPAIGQVILLSVATKVVANWVQNVAEKKNRQSSSCNTVYCTLPTDSEV